MFKLLQKKKKKKKYSSFWILRCLSPHHGCKEQLHLTPEPPDTSGISFQFSFSYLCSILMTASWKITIVKAIIHNSAGLWGLKKPCCGQQVVWELSKGKMSRKRTEYPFESTCIVNTKSTEVIWGFQVHFNRNKYYSFKKDYIYVQAPIVPRPSVLLTVYSSCHKTWFIMHEDKN